MRISAPAALATVMLATLIASPSATEAQDSGAGAPDCDPRMTKCPGGSPPPDIGEGEPSYDRKDMTPAQLCEAYAVDLSRSGYAQVRAYECSGRNFHYYAVKDGRPVTVRVRSKTGAIVWYAWR